MKIRAIGVFAALIGVVLAVTALVPSAPRTSAAGSEITISSAAANTTVTLGNNFTVTLAVTASAIAYKSIQWELAYGPNVSFVSDVYSCAGAPISFPTENETEPTEDTAANQGLVALSPLKILGLGANCASLNPPFAGTNALGTFVTVTLQCVSNGTSPVFGVSQATDSGFGTGLGDSGGGTITVGLLNQYATQSHGAQAGFDVICGQASTPIPATATNTPLPTNTPAPTATSTPCGSGGCPTATATRVGTATPEKVFTRTPTITATTPAGTTAGSTTPAAGAPQPAAPDVGGAPGSGVAGRTGRIGLPDTGSGPAEGGDTAGGLLLGFASLFGGVMLVGAMKLSRRPSN
jgi:hypothetical protein